MYMVLDEAQAIKSSSSARWKILLEFQCRNRLLLTGTPIQNSMAELWALLHFIMPTLFDSHEEFREWFAKDIELYAEQRATINEKHLSRLHMILKPFMLRREKKDVESELTDKIEVQLYCNLTQRQRALYQALKHKITVEELMPASPNGPSHITTSNLMNLGNELANERRVTHLIAFAVMQFRKLCNHPSLFERREARSPFHMKMPTVCLSRTLYRDGVFNVDNGNCAAHKLFDVFSVDNVFREESLRTLCSAVRLSSSQFSKLTNGSLSAAVELLSDIKNRTTLQALDIVWHENEINSDRVDMIIPIKSRRLVQNRNASAIWNELLFTGDAAESRAYAFEDHVFHYRPETAEHREMRLRKAAGNDIQEVTHIKRPPRTLCSQLTCLPKFTILPNYANVIASPVDVYFNDHQATSAWKRLFHNEHVCNFVDHGSMDKNLRQLLDEQNAVFYSEPVGGVAGVMSNFWSTIDLPDKQSLISDSGKLQVSLQMSLLERDSLDPLLCPGTRWIVEQTERRRTSRVDLFANDANDRFARRIHDLSKAQLHAIGRLIANIEPT